MSFGLIQQLMLLGLAGIALPVIAHLLSKRKFDIVFWGAMQFLELGRRTRRRIRLEELLLLLLRIGVIAILAFAFARPWGKGGLLSRLSESVRRDVVFVVDGSYSMGWQGGDATPHAAARQWIHKALEGLTSADTVSLLDARESVVPVIESPTSDFPAVRAELDELPAPAGSSRLAAAATRAVQLLSRTTNPVREVVVLTDGQAYPWSADDAPLWARFDDLVSQQTIRPRIWSVDVSDQDAGDRVNFSVDRIQLSRPMTVPDFPLRIRTTIRQFGGEPVRRTVNFAVNGQRLQDKAVVVNLPPNGEAPIEFEHRFPSAGSYLVTVSIESDALPGDNEAHAAVTVSSAVPVLLVDGQPHLDPVRSKSFFVQAALSPSGNQSPWIKATTVSLEEFQADRLVGQDVVFLLGVAALPESQLQTLKNFVQKGGGLIIAPGANAKPDFYNGSFLEAGQGLLPAQLSEVAEESQAAERPVLLDGDSFETPWMARFKPGSGVDLAATRFSQWWKLAPATADAAAANEATASSNPKTGDPVVAGRLKTGDPWLVTRSYGEGQVALAAASFDTEWSTLPSKNDFVPFLHELTFSMVSRNVGRNVETGMPLEFALPQNTTIQNIVFLDPDGKELPAQRAGDDRSPIARLDSATMPGVYRAVRKSRPHDSPEFFVVEFDRREADLAPLSEPQQKAIVGENRMRFIHSVDELQAAALEDAPRTELWWLLLIGVLALLVFEVAMTRRLIHRGHELVDAEPGVEDSTRFA